jgi:hypothetical protein
MRAACRKIADAAVGAGAHEDDVDAAPAIGLPASSAM